MIQLGSYDTGVSDTDRQRFLDEVKQVTRVPLDAVHAGPDKLEFQVHAPGPGQPMSVAAVQEGLRALGFFPGGKADGICGYRTLSAVRLFQEYVRSVEKLPCAPDGRFGPASQKHLTRWQDGGLTMAWASTIEAWRSGTLGQSEYTRWLALMENAKQRHLASPDRMLQLVNAFPGASDTRAVADWDFSPDGVHLLGIRRSEASGKFDDVFVLLIKGMVFKFQGSTEPGASTNPAGTPFLVRGQHDYHFGWQHKRYLALRPRGNGVLVVRSKNDKRLDEGDLDNGLEANGTINIHWGGKGLARNVNTWSEGCQVIAGSLYLDPADEFVDCSGFAALNQPEIDADPRKTRGAYNVLVDLVTALGSDLPGNTVQYTLLGEEDLAADPVLAQGFADARARVGAMLHGSG